MLIRLKVTLAKAIEKKIKLPRFVVVVLDNDLVQFLAFVNKCMASLIGEWFEWIAACYTELCSQRKDKLPCKAKRFDFPQIYFVAPPRHRNFIDNEERKILMNCMEATAKTMDNVRVVKIMEIWNPNNLELVAEDGQITPEGLFTYWESIDKAVAFNVRKRDEFLSRKGMKVKGNVNPNRKRSGAEEDMLFFKRMKNKKTPTHGLPSRTAMGRKLPTPPPAIDF